MKTVAKSYLSELKDWFLTWWQAALTGFFIGVTVTQFYAFNNLVNDCKVIGAFRIGNTAFMCRMDKT